MHELSSYRCRIVEADCRVGALGNWASGRSRSWTTLCAGFLDASSHDAAGPGRTPNKSVERTATRRCGGMTFGLVNTFEDVLRARSVAVAHLFRSANAHNAH